ncbi:hypothetical protein P171DRAFT_518197 [Karstenula rhodostoma CBS 690.94]|uniref:F-box domain-containing protein n=1 Tax=Karstenula rhodostoma CBS 690.94 TaxID=1392251 RepID=A0A9P4PTW2_9PLEO|nr:hypothetical protein P171DRAFT_518197 [Karstenula rhodostoma CBS 690.94]
MPLAQLSTELLLLIASHLSQLDLLNVSLASKYLHSATEPALYREFHPPCLQRRPLYLFIKALLKDPKRLQYVHSLQLPRWEIIDPPNEENRFEPDDVQKLAITEEKRLYHSMTLGWDPNKVPGQYLNSEDYELFTSAAAVAGFIRDVVPYEKGAVELKGVEKSYDVYGTTLYYWYYFSTADLETLPLDEKFCHLLRAGVDDAYMVLLLSLLTNLRRLTLTRVPRLDNALPWARALQRYFRFREFTAIPEPFYDKEYCPLSFWLDFLTLQNLELFTARGCASGWVQHDGVVIRSPCTRISDSLSISRLALENCVLEYSDLKLVLGACRDLKTFRYSMDRWREGTITSARIVELLAPFQMTLEELFLDNDSNAYLHWFDPTYEFKDQPFGSLAQFTHLERLWIPTNMCGWLPVAWEEYRNPAVTSTFAGFLPSSLKEFKIFDSHTYPVLTQPVLDCLLETASIELQELTTLEVISSHKLKDLNIIEEEGEIRRGSGNTFTYRIGWSHFNRFKLPRTTEETESYSYIEERYTCWDEDHYAMKTWEALQEPNILSEEEVEREEHKEVLAILADIEDAPTCNDEICELLEMEFDEVAMGLQYVQGA